VAINPYNRKPLKILSALAAVTLGLYGLLFAATTWGDAQWQPKLGLDLDGGTQLVLKPVLLGNAKVTSEQLTQARDIIVQRVDANGVAGAEVTTRNGQDIVVSVPGKSLDKTTEDAIRKSSQMRFRPVLAQAPGTNQPTPTSTGTATATGTATGTGTGTGTATGTATTSGPKATGRATSAGSPLPGAFVKSTTEPTPSGRSTTSPSGTATTGASSNQQNAIDLAWITDSVSKDYQALDCSVPGATDKIIDDPDLPLVTCSDDGATKYVLGPVVVNGDQIKDAAAGYRPLSNGQPSSTV
jgi:preprotein translocase subunit SecD